MKRSTPLKRSDKPMHQGGLGTASKREREVWDKLREQVGCAVCLFKLRIEGSRSQIHHILSGGNRISHACVIPLCPSHHQGHEAAKCMQHETGFTYRHSDRGADGGLAAFEDAYGDELDLLVKCEQWINDDYWTGLQDDEQAPYHDDNSADTDAHDQPDAGDVADGAKTVQGFSTPVRVVVTHKRHRLADPHGASDKWAMDAIVRAGVLQDDSAKEIEEIIERQQKIPRSEKETTIFTITEVSHV